MVGRIDVKRKGSALVGYWVQYVTLTFDLTHDLDLVCFKVKFQNRSISRIVGLIDVKWKGSELIWYWANCMTLPFDHTHDLDLGVSRSESEIALSQEWGSRLTMNEKDVSHPFMTMILTCVTVVAWADVPDSDRGDFRRRRAVDITSFSLVLSLGSYQWNGYGLNLIFSLCQTHVSSNGGLAYMWDKQQLPTNMYVVHTWFCSVVLKHIKA